MSIRLRLTLLYTAILAFTLIVFSVVLYTAQERYTLNIVKQDLEGRAAQLAMTWGRLHYDFGFSGPGPAFNRPGESDGPDYENLQRVARGGNRPPDMLRLLDVDGQPLDFSFNTEFEDVTLSSEGLAQLQVHGQWTEIVPSKHGRIYIYSRAVVSDSVAWKGKGFVSDTLGEISPVGIVQVARSLADRDRSLRSLGLTLIGASALTTVIAFGVGWTLSGITLRPIHRITETAHKIGEEQDFSSRVEHHGPDDELGRLARTFNEMLSQLQNAYQQMAHALQVQRDFVADVSHELRTPLTTIRGNLALLEHDPPLPQEEQLDILSDLTSESERLSRLVTDLLQLARADAGRKLALGTVCVIPLIEEVCRQTRLLAPERNITYAAYQDADTLVAYANEDALKQVLLILMDNAIKHTLSSIGTIVDSDEQALHIRVQDNGPGMSPDLQARIFDRFYRGDSSRSTPGFGLGLSIARVLIEAQHGDILIESEIGKGSTFIITLPLA